MISVLVALIPCVAAWISSEHKFIGDSVSLSFPTPSPSVPGSSFNYPGVGVNLSFGDLVALSGDLFAASQPISDGVDATTRTNTFLAGFRSVFDGDEASQAGPLVNFITIILHSLLQAVRAGEDPPTAVDRICNENHCTTKYSTLTHLRYLSLAKTNWDHFRGLGSYSTIAYTTGHIAAMSAAAGGNLPLAYALDAFACHYLTDGFAAGHIRTPRKALHAAVSPSSVGDLLSKYQHDEANAQSLSVSASVGDGSVWNAYGDGHLFLTANADNMKRVIAAAQSSVDEVFQAFQQSNSPHASSSARPAVSETVSALVRLANAPVTEVTDLPVAAGMMPLPVGKNIQAMFVARPNATADGGFEVDRRKDINNLWDLDTIPHCVHDWQCANPVSGCWCGTPTLALLELKYGPKNTTDFYVA
eukprot:TRINITY_DN21015_c0_g1_i1.p1 TRINITY_DN21015_c0_g1~~TRINITY_DN21015_c0_g1_i1.p1  ORF type:complete len:417 (+),score=50.78 TRINITY_DN21015_c0_g1_i1:97-1347(+)